LEKFWIYEKGNSNSQHTCHENIIGVGPMHDKKDQSNKKDNTSQPKHKIKSRIAFP
jgi:hypothetical protein